jgi:hypothetical protein
MNLFTFGYCLQFVLEVVFHDDTFVLHNFFVNKHVTQNVTMCKLYER